MFRHTPNLNPPVHSDRLIMGCLALGLLLLPSLAGCSRKSPETATNSIDRPIPEFSLTNEQGNKYGSTDLQGKVWIANFIFTTCPKTCPMQTKSLVQLQQALKDHSSVADLQFVSISVNPEADTPEVLKAYAEKQGADLTNWSFLTGERAAIWELCQKGFLLPVAYETKSDPDSLITHSPKFVLVGRNGKIQKFYDGLKDDDLAKLQKDLEQVLADKPSK